MTNDNNDCWIVIYDKNVTMNLCQELRSLDLGSCLVEIHQEIKYAMHLGGVSEYKVGFRLFQLQFNTEDTRKKISVPWYGQITNKGVFLTI